MTDLNDPDDKKGEPSSGEVPSSNRDLIRKLSAKADQAGKAGRQLALGKPSDFDQQIEAEVAKELTDVQNPDESHRIYYTIQSLLKAGLPGGPANAELRDYVYEEKNIYLNRGKKKDASGIRGSDGRMGYLPHLRAALGIAREWSAAGGTAFDVFLDFRLLNEKLGYRKPGEQ